jgi:hypothetical protein
MFRSSLLAALILVGISTTLAAQQPTEEQRACTLNDFIAHCSWIKPDSPEILLCLKANAAALSPPCQAAVGSAQAAPAQPAAEAQPAEGAPPAEAAPPPTRRRPGVVHPHVAAPPSGPPPGEAQQPSPEQAKAVRTACRSDFMAR